MVKSLGGRIKLNVGDEVRYLDMYGCSSSEIYIIDSDHTDFRARASLKNGDSVILIHYDKILPLKTGGKAIVVLGDKKLTITCPECHKVQGAKPGQSIFTCCSALEVFFMSNSAETAQVQENSKFDLNTLKNEYEIWVKNGGKFNETIELTTVQLVLLDGDVPRKMSFNLYGGQLSTGGKQVDLRLDEFKSGQVAEGKKQFWYKVDISKYQKALDNKGYTKI